MTSNLFQICRKCRLKELRSVLTFLNLKFAIERNLIARDIPMTRNSYYFQKLSRKSIKGITQHGIHLLAEVCSWKRSDCRLIVINITKILESWISFPHEQFCRVVYVQGVEWHPKAKPSGKSFTVYFILEFRTTRFAFHGILKQSQNTLILCWKL